jgi:hypothetical protein
MKAKISTFIAVIMISSLSISAQDIILENIGSDAVEHIAASNYTTNKCYMFGCQIWYLNVIIENLGLKDEKLFVDLKSGKLEVKSVVISGNNTDL